MNESVQKSEIQETEDATAEHDSSNAATTGTTAPVRDPESSVHNHNTNLNSDHPVTGGGAHHQNSKQKHVELQSDSEVEDVTDQYVKRKRAASPEIIEVEDVSSDEEDNNVQSSRAEPTLFEAAHDKNQTNSHNAAKNQTNQDDDESDSDEESYSSFDSSVEDVTEMMLAKKKEQFLKEIDGAIELGSGSEEEDSSVRMTSSRPRKRRRILQSPIEVLLDTKDVPSCPGQKCLVDDKDDTKSDMEESKQPDNVDHTIKQRIVKLLNTGFHSESNENEAKNAMKLARRLMDRYNLDQSVLLRERGDGSLNDFSTTNDADLGGAIINVSIQHRKKGKALKNIPRWLDFLVQPICANFHIDAFKTLTRATKYKEGECTISFYGMRTNAQLAAYAYKIASERISLMAANFIPAEMANKKSNLKNARLSYALGIVIGLDRSVTQELRREEERRKSRLNKARKATKGDACDDSSDDGSNSTLDGDDAENPIDLTLDQLEDENAAQLALVDHQKKIAETILKVSRMSCAA